MPLTPEELQRIDAILAEQSPSVPTSTAFDFENELKALAQGAVRGLSLGVYEGPRSLRPEEGRVWERDIPFLSDIPGIGEAFKKVSPSRALGEVATMVIPLGLASKVGRAILGTAKIAGVGGKAAQLGGSKLTRFFLSPETFERELGTAALRSGGEIADQALRTGSVDWKDVSAEGALGLMMGLTLSPVAEKALGRGVEGYKKLFKRLPPEVIEKTNIAITRKLAVPGGIPEMDRPQSAFSPNLPLQRVLETGTYTRRLATTPEKRISDRQLQNFRVNEWVAQHDQKLMTDVREAGIKAANELNLTTTEVFDNAQIWAGLGKEIGLDDIHKTQAWIDAQRKYEKLGLGEFRGKGKTTTEAQLRGLTPQQLEAERVDIAAAQIARRTTGGRWVKDPKTGDTVWQPAQYLELPEKASLGQPQGISPLLGLKEAKESAPYAQVAMGKYRKAVQDVRDLDQKLYKKDAAFVRNIEADLKVGIPVSDPVMSVYREAKARMMGSEAKELSKIPVSGLPKIPAEGTRVETPQGTLRFVRLKKPVSGGSEQPASFWDNAFKAADKALSERGIPKVTSGRFTPEDLVKERLEFEKAASSSTITRRFRTKSEAEKALGAVRSRLGGTWRILNSGEEKKPWFLYYI